MAKTTVRHRKETRGETRPVNRFGVLDSAPIRPVMLGRADAKTLSSATGVSAAVARRLVAARRAK